MRPKNRVLAWVAAALGVAVLGLSACAPPNPSASGGTLVVAGYGGSYQDAFTKSVIPNFEKSCGCKVTYIAGTSTDTLAKLKAQQASPQIDVALLDDGPQAQAAEAQLVTALDPKIVTNLDQVHDIARLPGDTGVGFGITATGIAYNTKWYEEHGVPAPTKWTDLANPQLKGALVLPSITNTYGVGFLAMAAAVNGGSEQNIQPGFDQARQIAANAVTFDTTADVSNYFLQGQAAASVWGVGRVQLLAAKDFPIKFVYPEEGTPALLATANVVNKAPHGELAQKFVSYLLQADAQQEVAKATFDGSVVKGVPEVPELVGKVVGPDQIDKLRKLDWKTINQHRAEWTDQWNKQVESS